MGDEYAGASTMRYDSAPARRRSILELVGQAGFISVTELTRRLGVSDMTVRRDLRKLERDTKVRVVHGGVSSLQGPLHSPAFAGRAELQADGKRVIGVAAASTVRLDQSIGVDAGTTTYALVQALPDRYRGTVVTHSVPVMQLLLNRGIGSVVGLGGDLRADSQAFVGPMTVEATKGLRIQTFFLGAAAADERGVYVATDNERPTKLAMMAIADRVVLLVDAEKFSAPASVLLCGWDEIDEIISDAALPAGVARHVQSNHVAIRSF